MLYPRPVTSSWCHFTTCFKSNICKHLFHVNLEVLYCSSSCAWCSLDKLLCESLNFHQVTHIFLVRNRETNVLKHVWINSLNKQRLWQQSYLSVPATASALSPSLKCTTTCTTWRDLTWLCFCSWPKLNTTKDHADFYRFKLLWPNFCDCYVIYVAAVCSILKKWSPLTLGMKKSVLLCSPVTCEALCNGRHAPRLWKWINRTMTECKSPRVRYKLKHLPQM